MSEASGVPLTHLDLFILRKLIIAQHIDKIFPLTTERVSPASMSALLRSANPVEILASLVSLLWAKT
jgi:hypothetical protein